MNRITGRAAFGHAFSVKVSRTGDYLTHAWIAFELPTVKLHVNEYQWGGPDAYTDIPMVSRVYFDDLRADLPDVLIKNPDGTYKVRLKGSMLYRWFGPSARIRWCKKLAHNLVDTVKVTVNDLSMCSVNSQWLDFWSEFMLPPEKAQCYNEMIGNTERWTDPMRFYNRQRTDAAYDDIRNGISAPGGKLQLPIPLPFSREYGTCLPCAAIPYNEIRIHTTLANWSDVLVVDYPYGCSFGGNDRGTYFSDEQAMRRGKMIQDCLHVMWLNRYAPSPDYVTGYLTQFHPISTEETTTTQTVKASSSVNTQTTVFFFLSDVAGSSTTTVETGSSQIANATGSGTTATGSSKSLTDVGTTTTVQSVESLALLAATIDVANRKRRADIIAYLANVRVIAADPAVNQDLSSYYMNDWNALASSINTGLTAELAISSFKVTTINRPIGQRPSISDLADVMQFGDPSDSCIFHMTGVNNLSICIDSANFVFFINETLTSPAIVEACKSNKYQYLSMHLDYTDAGVSYETSIYKIQYSGARIVLSPKQVVRPILPSLPKYNSRRLYGYKNGRLISVRSGNINPPPCIVSFFNATMFTYMHCELLIRLTGRMPLSAYVDTAVSSYVTTTTTQLLQNGASIYRQRIRSIIAARMLLDPTCLLFPFVATMEALQEDDWRFLADNLGYWTGWMWACDYKRNIPPPTALVMLVEAFGCSTSCSESKLQAIPEIISASWWFNYAIVHSSERQRMGLEKRACVCEWMQRADDVGIQPDSSITKLNLFFKNAVRALFFCVKNETIPSERSHYDARSTRVSWDGTSQPFPITPIVQTISLFYGKVGKFEKMPLDHFSLVEPFYHANLNSVSSGFSMLSFCNDIRIAPPNGHVNFSNLTNISVEFEETSDVTLLKEDRSRLPVVPTKQSLLDAQAVSDRQLSFNQAWRYSCCVYALTNSVIEISRGTLKFLF
jgi:hypothetical protein